MTFSIFYNLSFEKKKNPPSHFFKVKTKSFTLQKPGSQWTDDSTTQPQMFINRKKNKK